MKSRTLVGEINEHRFAGIGSSCRDGFRLLLIEPGVIVHRCVLLVLLKYGGMLNRRCSLMSPSLIFGFGCGLLLSDCGDIFAEQPQAQRTDGEFEDTFVDLAEDKLYGPLRLLVNH